MKGPKAALFGLTLGLSGATAGYALTSNGTKSAEVDPTLDEEAQVCKIPTLSGSPEFQKANSDIERALIDAGIDPALVAEARNNPDRPIPPDWWAIILKFLTVMGPALTIDVAFLTLFMKRLKTPQEQIRWATVVPALHWIFPEITGRIAGATMTGWPLSFAAAACFVALISKMHFGEEKEANILTGTWAATVFTATPVTLDAAAAGPGIANEAVQLGTTPEIANALSAFGGVFACTVIAIYLQRHKDKLLEWFSEDKAETVGTSLATGAFAFFLFDCLKDGLNDMFGGNIPPEILNSAVGGLSAMSPVASYQFLIGREAADQITDSAENEPATEG